MSSLPTARHLKQLSIRGAIALSFRATLRIKVLFQNVTFLKDAMPDGYSERMFNLSHLILESFCKGELGQGSSRLSQIMEGDKWSSREEESVNIVNPIIRSTHLVLSAAMKAQFGHRTKMDVIAFSVAQNLIKEVQDSLEAAFEAATIEGEQYRAFFLKEVLRDYQSLQGVNTILFPELGPSIDMSDRGIFGKLWHYSKPEKSMGISSYELVVDEQASSRESEFSIGDRRLSSPSEGYLYKYVCFDALQKILIDSTLRFSRVSDFNDPFDGQILPVRKFTGNQFFEALRSETLRLSATVDEPIYKLPDNESKEAMLSGAAQFVLDKFKQEDKKYIAISASASDDAKNTDKLSTLLRPLIYLAQNRKIGLSEENGVQELLTELLDLFENEKLVFNAYKQDKDMISALAENIYVTCFSEVPDSLLMWAHYADDHNGAVLQFDTLNESSNFFTGVRPVIYERELPSSGTPISLARRYLGVEDKSPEEFMSRQFFTKSQDWAYEKEWRVMASTTARKNNTVPFEEQILVSIYLGCRFDSSKVQEVLDIAIDNKLSCDIFLSVKDDHEYSLSYIPISRGRIRNTSNEKIDEIELGRLYRWCLDTAFEIWRGLNNGDVGELRVMKSEGILADCGPSGSLQLFREMIQEIKAIFDSSEPIIADKEKKPEEYEGQYLKIIANFAVTYGELENDLKKELACYDTVLPEHIEVEDE